MEGKVEEVVLRTQLGAMNGGNLVKVVLALVITPIVGCAAPERYHEVKTFMVTIHTADRETINEQGMPHFPGRGWGLEGFASWNTSRSVCEIWRQRGETHWTGHEVQHCIGEIGDNE